MSPAVPSGPRDVTGGDLALAVSLAVVVLALSALALSISPLGRSGEAAAIDPGAEVPISITPVADLAAGTPAHGSEAALPSGWQRKPAGRRKPKPRPQPEDPATPPPEPTPTPTPTPPNPRAKPPLPGVQDPPATPEDPSSPPADPAPNDPAPSDPAGDGGEGGDAPGDEGGDGGGGGEGDTDGGGGGDPVGDRAIAAYRQRLTRWLGARFRVTGSGLGRAELLKYRVKATIRISDDGDVTGYDIVPSGSAIFDRAARDALDSIVGERVPPPPDDYPGALQPVVHTTFVCKESTCD